MYLHKLAPQRRFERLPFALTGRYTTIIRPRNDVEALDYCARFDKLSTGSQNYSTHKERRKVKRIWLL